VPLVSDEHGRRLAKREADLSLAELRAAGTDPRAIVAWAANSAGMNVAERVTAPEISTLFDVKRLPREAVRMTRDALEALKNAR
jgi:glutamyl/glutaminyl-tRNA synthetase